MKRLTTCLAIGAMAVTGLGFVGSAASATTTTLTLTQPATTALDGAPFTLTATASEAGTVAFSANSTPISGCATEVAIGTGSSFVASCPWTPPLTTVGSVSIGAELTPTVIADGVADATPVTVSTDSVSLAGSAIYLGQNEKVTATTYSVGSVTFSQDSSPLPGCSDLATALNGNETAYVVSCTITGPASSDTISAAFTPTSGANTSGTATYAMVVNTVVLKGGAGAVVGSTSTLTADANESGTVEFATVVSDVDTAISGCGAVTTASTAVPYVFTCAFTPSAVGTTQVVAILTPTSGPTETSSDLNVTAADIVLSGGSAIYDVSPGTIVASTDAAGTVTFDTVTNDVATPISGCSNVATIGASAPYVDLCTWTPSAAGPAVLGATFTPTSGSPATAADLDVTVGTPIQGQEYPISMYVDTILASSGPGTPTSPIVGTGCEITNEFLVGQTIVFRVYGNDAQLDGAPLTPTNVSSAYVTIAGYSGSPITMSFGSHGGEAFWVGVLVTGTSTGQYDTLGVIPYTVTFKTTAVPGVPAKTKLVKIYKRELVKVRVGTTIKKEWRRVLVGTKKVIVKAAVPAIPGATGTFNSAFNPASQATLNAVPTV